MDGSIFMDKSIIPDEGMLKEALGDRFPLWQQLCEFVNQLQPSALNEWNFPGAKYGWSFRIKDKKRAIIYLLPRENYFMVAFVFGQKATDIIMQSQVSREIQTELSAARVYAEGRGIRIPLHNELIIPDILELIRIKIAN